MQPHLHGTGSEPQKLRGLLDHISDHGFTAHVVPRLIEIVPDIAGLMAALEHARADGATRPELL